MENLNTPSQLYLKPIGTYPNQSSELTTVQLFQNKIQWIQCTISGAMILGKEALIENEFKTYLLNRLNEVRQEIKKFEDLTDEKQIKQYFPILHQYQLLMQEIRQIFFKVIKTHKADKFKVRVIEGRDYSHRLQVNFKITDGMNNRIQKNLSKFFQDMIIQKLENQFDTLCDEMLTIIDDPEIDIQGGADHLLKIAKNASEEDIKSILSELAEYDEQARKKHTLVKSLHERKQHNKVLKAKNDIDQQCQKIEQKEFQKDLKNVLQMTNKYFEFIQDATDNFAREFLITFYSGEIKKQKQGFDPQPMFIYFIHFISNHFGFQICDTSDIEKEFCQKIDADGNLSVDVSELSEFFKNYVDLQNKKVNLEIAKGIISDIGQAKALQKNYVKYKIVCLEDFGNDEKIAQKRRQEEGILKKDVEIELEIEDGARKNF